MNTPAHPAAPAPRPPHAGPDILDIPGTRFAALISEVADTTGLVGDPDDDPDPMPVPGMEDTDRYMPWGWDDRLPYELIGLVGSDEVTAQNKLFNVLTCYGAGPRLTLADRPQPDPARALAQLREAAEWAERQAVPAWFMEQITDMKYFYFAVSVVILSRDGRRVNRLVHKEACHTRLAPADRNGRVRWVYYADWRRPRRAPVERLPLLDPQDPLTDLRERMGLAPGRDGRTRPRPERSRKYAFITRFPTAGCQYYPTPYWSAMLRGGSYDEKRLISTAKRAKLRNHTSVKYLVEVEQGYWGRICREEFITEPRLQKERIRREKENIRDFVAGVENSGKVWISSYYVNPDGQEVHDVRVTRIDTAKEGGDWNEDVQAAANTVCYADNIHPNLVGATPGKSQMNNSGSDKRELFTMKQALETAWRYFLLRPLRLALSYNGWDCVETEVPLIQLTTLDRHADAALTT